MCSGFFECFEAGIHGLRRGGIIVSEYIERSSLIWALYDFLCPSTDFLDREMFFFILQISLIENHSWKWSCLALIEARYIALCIDTDNIECSSLIDDDGESGASRMEQRCYEGMHKNFSYWFSTILSIIIIIAIFS
jgi:hypothetical protein